MRINKKLLPLLVSVLAVSSLFAWQVTPVVAATRLDGRILLQVEDKGQAWYVNPQNSQRYYLGRPNDAFNLMRSLGLGVSNHDIAKFQTGAPARLAGRILLQVQDKGQAYYVNPLSLRLHYLGRPEDAFNLMRQLGLGISELDLAKIPRFNSADTSSSSSLARTAVFKFKYLNSPYELNQTLTSTWYESYLAAPKVYTYSSANPPANVRDAFYGLFLKTKSSDQSISDLAAQLKSVAEKNKWSSDQLAEFSLALIQYIPYDEEKVSGDSNRNNNPYYPYETLYLNKGVCSDKTFLAVTLLRELGFGAAILDFPESNHSAVGISCPVSDSLEGSGYCYGETTNYFPLGVVPSSLASGQAQIQSGFNVSFSAASLGKMEIYQSTSGRQYGLVAATKKRAQEIADLQAKLGPEKTALLALETAYQAKEGELISLRERLDDYLASGQISAYNQLISEYNSLVSAYNQGVSDYQKAANAYNAQVNAFNQAVRDFYQK